MNPMDFLELILSLSLQASVVVLVAHGLSRLTRDERMQCLLWQMCFGGLLAVTAIALALPHVRWTAARPVLDRQTTATIAHWELRIGTGLFVVWCIGAGLTLVVGIVRWFRLRQFLATCKELEDFRRAAVIETVRTQFAMPDLDQTRLLVSRSLVTPFCTQFHRPYVVLPAYVMDFTPDELALIIRHELEHLRTGHPLQLFLQRVAEVVFWFHPMVWWASHQSELSREFVCDGVAANSPDAIVRYLKVLLRVAEQATGAEPAYPLSFGRVRSSLARRAERLLHKAQQPETFGSRSGLKHFIAPAFIAVSLPVLLLWLPVNILTSPRSAWSPWPSASARVLHDFGFPVRDYEVYHPRGQIHELLETERATDGMKDSPPARPNQH